MRAVIVYESLFGNTKMLSDAIAAALRARYEVVVIRAADASLEYLAQADLIVLGAPTHAHGMSQPGTRRGTANQGVAPEVAMAPGMRELLTKLVATRDCAAVAFDTRVRGPRWLTGSASRGIAGRLRRAGFRVLVPPESFLVTGTRGPLVEGEVERAGRWGETLAERANGSHPHATAA